MSLRSKLKRLQKRAGEHFTIVRCPECGEEVAVRATGDDDVAMRLLVAAWAKEVGQEREPDPVVERILGHPHDVLLVEILRDIPGASLA